MTFLRNLWRDLLERRLLPVVAVLVVALVAVPVMIGSGSDDPATGAAGATPRSVPSDGGAQAAVSLDTQVSAKQVDRAGNVRNPFKPEHAQKIPTTTSSTSAPASKASTTPANTVKPAKSSTPGGKSSSSGGQSGAWRWYAWRADVRLGSHEAMRNHKNLRYVTALPSRSYALVAFLGVEKDHSTVAFDVSSGIFVTGDGKCTPSKLDCHLLELKKGESALLTKRAGASHFKRYRLRVLDTHFDRVAAPAAKAKAAKAGSPIELAGDAVAG